MAFNANPECDSQEWGSTHKINNVSPAAYPGLLKMVPNESLGHGLRHMDRYAKYLICIFKNINEIVRNQGNP